jgi:hypothetical protein
VNFKEEG